jgi:hypothetical protein
LTDSPIKVVTVPSPPIAVVPAPADPIEIEYDLPDGNVSAPEIYELEFTTVPDNAGSFVFNPPAPPPPPLLPPPPPPPPTAKYKALTTVPTVVNDAFPPVNP